VAGTLVCGAIPQAAASPGPALTIVANAVAVAPTSTERLAGNIAAASTMLVTLFWTKVAVTLTAALIVTTQDAVPPHSPPDQPANVELAPAAAVRVICVPISKLELHVGPQLMPEGLLVTVPEPLPEGTTDSM